MTRFVTMPPGHAALRRGRASLPGHAYHITATTRDRCPVFADRSAARMAATCFSDAGIIGDAAMLAWVLMPDHAHWLLQLGARDDLATVVNRLKSASARKVNVALGRTGPLWGRAYHDHGIRSGEDLAAVAAYIIANPVRAGIAECIDEYPYQYSAYP